MSLFTDERHPSTVPGAFEIEIEREVPGLGVIRFEQCPMGWLKKDGTPRLQDHRAYWFTPAGGKRVRLPSVTTWLGAVLPKDLSRWGEEHGIRGCWEAIARGELDPSENTEEDAVERVRALKLGADAARDRAATRGIDVHALFEQWGRTGSLPTLDVPLELQGYVQGVQNFIREYEPEPDVVEQLVADPERGYAGRMDLRGVVRSKAMPIRAMRVVDAKTSPKLSIWPAAHYQTRSYSEADRVCGGPETDTPLIVVFDAEGRFDVADCAVSSEQLDRALAYYRDVKPLDSACSSRHYALRRAA